MIVMFTHKETWFSHLTFGSVSDKVLKRGGNIPIMVVRTENLMS